MPQSPHSESNIENPSVKDLALRPPEEKGGLRIALSFLHVLCAGILAGCLFRACRQSEIFHLLFTGQPLDADQAGDLLKYLLLYPIGLLILWGILALTTRRKGADGLSPEGLSLRLRRAAWVFTPWWLAVPVLLALRYEKVEDIIRSAAAICLGLFVALIWRLYDYRPLGRVFLRSARIAESEETAEQKTTDSDGTPRKRLWFGWSGEARVLVVCAVVYFFVFTAMSWLRHLNFFSLLTDLGMHAQQCWGLINGHGFHCSFYKAHAGLVDMNMLSEHVMLIFVPLAPFYALWPDPRMLLLIQSVAIAMAVWPIYRIALWFSGGGDEAAGFRPWALALALSFLLHPRLQTAHLFDFHPDAFLPLFMSLAILSLLRRRWILYWVTLFLALSVKEDTALAVAVLGVYGAVIRRRPAVGVATFVVGAAWFIAAVGIVIPHYRGETYRHIDQYAYLIEPFIEGSPDDLGVFQFMWIGISHPVEVISRAICFARVDGALQTFGPTLAVSLLAPAELLLALPNLAATMLSDDIFKQTMDHHYSLTLLAYIYFSAAAGGAVAARFAERRRKKREAGCDDSARAGSVRSGRLGAYAFLAVAVFFASLFMCYWHGEAPLARGFAKRKYRSDPRWVAGRELVKLVPPDAAVSAQHDVAPHLINRYLLFDFPVAKKADYIVLNLHVLQDGNMVWTFSSNEHYARNVRHVLTSGKWGLIERREGFLLLKRDADTSRNEEALEMMRAFLREAE